MSSHCSRYPNCGCNSYCGTKCQLAADHPALLKKEDSLTTLPFSLSANDMADELERMQILDEIKKLKKLRNTATVYSDSFNNLTEEINKATAQMQLLNNKLPKL